MEFLENSMNLIYKVNKSLSINEILSSEFHFSIRLKNKLIKSKNILLNGVFVDTRTIVKQGDIITIILDYAEDNSNIVPIKMDLDIIYEDEFLLAINKPYSIPVHPSMLHFTNSLSNGIKYYYDSINLHKKIRAVNRIDLNTSGLVLFAKNEYVQELLINQMKNGIFKKTYLALASGKFEDLEGTISAPIARKPGSIIERHVSKEGQNSITHYKVLKQFKNYSLVECTLETGRTHQIRVHMAHIGHPLLGDSLYNNCSDLKLINRQALHCFKMDFTHPITSKRITFEAPIPPDIKKLI